MNRTCLTNPIILFLWFIQLTVPPLVLFALFMHNIWNMETEPRLFNRNQMLQDELQSLEGVQPVSRSCKEYALFAFLFHPVLSRTCNFSSQVLVARMKCRSHKMPLHLSFCTEFHLSFLFSQSLSIMCLYVSISLVLSLFGPWSVWSLSVIVYYVVNVFHVPIVLN